MIKKTIKYTDYNGVERTEDFYFHLTQAELMDMEMTISGGLSAKLDAMIKANDMVNIIETFKDIVMKSYGVKSDDGRMFIKTDEVKKDFMYTEAFSEIYMELATNTEAATKFINGIIPEKVKNNASTNS